MHNMTQNNRKNTGNHMQTRLGLILTTLCSLPLLAQAESSLVYELTDAAGATSEQTYTLHGRWARVDRKDAAQANHLILDTGFMIMYVVDSAQSVFSTFGESPHHQGEKLTPSAGSKTVPTRAEGRSSDAITLAPTGGRDSVAGIRCNLVNEIVDGKTVAEHCMADAAALGMNQREMITMARLIDFSRQWTDPDWIAIQRNEQFVSIRSRPANGDPTFILKAVSHDTPPGDFFRVPPSYRKLDTGGDFKGLITGSK